MIEQSEAGETLTHDIGDGNRLETLHVDEHMNLAGGGASDPVLRADQLEGKRQAPSADGLHLHADAQTFTQAHGSLEVGVGVDQGHTPAKIVEDRRPGRIDGQEELLKGHVSVLKDPTVKGNASPIDLMEPNADLVGESHKVDSARQSETQGVDDASSLEGTR